MNFNVVIDIYGILYVSLHATLFGENVQPLSPESKFYIFIIDKFPKKSYLLKTSWENSHPSYNMKEIQYEIASFDDVITRCCIL